MLTTAPDTLLADVRDLLLLDAALEAGDGETGVAFADRLVDGRGVKGQDLEDWRRMFRASLRELRTVGAVLNADEPVLLSRDEWEQLQASVHRIKQGLLYWTSDLPRRPVEGNSGPLAAGF